METTIRPNYLRVTEIFSPYVSFDHINPVTLHNACERGKKVHSLCEMYMLDSYFPEPDKELVGYLESFRGWYTTMVDRLISTEQRIYNDELMLTGQIDIVAVLCNDTYPTIIDIKTPAIESKSWCLQLEAYRYLYNNDKETKIRATRRIALQLDKKGKPPKIREYTDHKQDLDLYLGLLKAWRYFK